ncbi:MAG: hypothetical protein AAGG65_11100 [Pseudomonadota bacterium]
MSSDPHYGTTTYQKASELDSWIETQFRGALTAAVTYEQEVLTDWGLLRAMGKLAGGGGPWERSATYVGDAELVSYKPFKLWLYQQLMPFKYRIYYQDSITKADIASLKRLHELPDYVSYEYKVGTDRYNFYAVVGLDNDGLPSEGCLKDIWNNGGVKFEFFVGRNGWQIMKRVKSYS